MKKTTSSKDSNKGSLSPTKERKSPANHLKWRNGPTKEPNTNKKSSRQSKGGGEIQKQGDKLKDIEFEDSDDSTQEFAISFTGAKKNFENKKQKKLKDFFPKEDNEDE